MVAAALARCAARSKADREGMRARGRVVRRRFNGGGFSGTNVLLGNVQADWVRTPAGGWVKGRKGRARGGGGIGQR